MRSSNLVAALSLFALIAACSTGETTAPAAEAGPDGAAATAAAPPPGDTAAPEQSVGTVRFAVDGVEKHFDHLPESENVYLRLSSAIRAHPAAGATEALAITFLSIDLKQHSYPSELPPPKDPQSTDLRAAMAMVGFSYLDGDGVEWAGPGKIRIESFASDGVLSGTFDEVTLPHTDKQRADVTLTGGAFRARVSAPW